MPPYMPLRFGIVERRCNHIAKKRVIPGRGSFFSHIFFRISFFFSLTFSSTFSYFLGFVFQSFLALLGYVIVKV